MSAVDNTFGLQIDKKLGICDIHLGQKASVMYKMKWYKISSKPKVFVKKTFFDTAKLC